MSIHQWEKNDHLRCVERIRVMLLIIAILLLILWGGGFAFHVAGGLFTLTGDRSDRLRFALRAGARRLKFHSSNQSGIE